MKPVRLNDRCIYDKDPTNPKGPFNLLKKYRSKLPQGWTGDFYLYPFTAAQLRKGTGVVAQDGGPAWYNPLKPIGKNNISKLKELCTEVGCIEAEGGVGQPGGLHGMSPAAAQWTSPPPAFETPAISSVQGTKQTSPEGLLEAPNSRLRVNTPALTPGTIGGATAPASALEANPDLGNELRALKKFYEEGLMTESEYTHARRKALGLPS